MQFRSAISVIAMLLFVSSTLLSQNHLEFEVASIRPSNPQGPQVTGGFHTDGAQARFTLVSLGTYVSYAYEVRTYQITGPDWLRSQLFDVSAKMPEGAKVKDVPQMIRSLLTERFGLKVHRETREFPVSSLEISKAGLKMKELPSDPETEANQINPLNVTFVAGSNGGVFNLGGGATFSGGEKGFEAKKLSMNALAYMLAPFLDRPSVDGTATKGLYDFVLQISPEDMRALQIRSAVNAGVSLPPQMLRILDNSSGDSLINALDKLGLTLVSRKTPMEVIVVDAMQKTPTEN